MTQPCLKVLPHCRACKHEVDAAIAEYSTHRRQWEVTARCHGETITERIGDLDIINGIIWKELMLFDMPLCPPIIDHDPGDEDPLAHKEPQWMLWQ